MEKTLVVMAAGMGSRFGGLKQIEPVGPNGEFIIDYSVYDALRAGFTKIVFVIKEDLFDVFKSTIGKRVESHIKVEYAFQKIDDVPFEVNKERQKPWGTAQAIYSTREFIHENFAIINADDFYGSDAFIRASKFLDVISDNNFGLVGYKADNTLTENGSVKRGVLEIDKGKLISIEESTLEGMGDHIHCTSLVDNHEYDIPNYSLVSMNLLLFTPRIFKFLEDGFVSFKENMTDELKDEYLIPTVVADHIKNGDITVEIIDTTAKWYGVTYKEDKEHVCSEILKLIDEGVYKKDLWN